MARKVRQKEDAVIDELNKQRTSEWKTSRGLSIVIKALPPLLMAGLEDSVDFPEKPTYEVTTVAGDVEIYEHSADTLETPEDKVAWAKYQALTAVAQDKLTEITLRTVLYEGVDIIDEEEELRKWRSKRELLELRVPKEEERALLLFKETEVIGCDSDMEYILSEAMRLTGVSEAVIEAASRSFQGEVESEPQTG